MKCKLIFTLLFLYTVSGIAREGMWLPFLLGSLNESEMKHMGMKISARDIYDINEGSLKDAVVIFGGGCTGEIISSKGLVLTNHHCGYGTVQSLSSVEHDYLSNGFWAMNMSEELPCPGLSVTFIVRIDDVTQRVNLGLQAQMADSTRARIRQQNIESLQKKYKDSTGYDALIKSFYYDNAFYIFMTEKYTDVRLVGFPPNGIGKFGGDTDNWAWPRHTGDFGVFRIYANAQNKPAAYSKENVPFQPKRSIVINMDGIREKDFTWVYGFPGRTSEYLSSTGVAEIMEVINPIRIRMRKERLAILDESMRSKKELFIKYASKQAGIANNYKKWVGELQGLKKNRGIQKKEQEEKAFLQWIDADQERRTRYGSILSDLASAYQKQKNWVIKNEYLNEAIGSCELIKQAAQYKVLLKKMDSVSHVDSIQSYRKKLTTFLQQSDVATDRTITLALFKHYQDSVEHTSFGQPEYIEQMYQLSFLASEAQLDALFGLKNLEDMKEIIQRDPAWKAYGYFDSIQTVNTALLRKNQQQINALYSKYLEALLTWKGNKVIYPDANSTMRVTYGKVEGLQPQDGMTYTFQTTLDGAVAKHRPDEEEFTLPNGLLDLYDRKDYGPYGILVNGKPTVPLAFLASNHTTQGNSGSPVFNADGELIGTNFDRIWEGTMSDVLFDPNLCRNIVLDIRYTLFIIDKFGKAGWLLDEMKFNKSAHSSKQKR